MSDVKKKNINPPARGVTEAIENAVAVPNSPDHAAKASSKLDRAPAVTDKAETADSSRLGDPTSTYFKGRDFPGQTGSRRARIRQGRAKTQHPPGTTVDLRPKRLLPPLNATPDVARRSGREATQDQLTLHDRISDFEEFQKAILPVLYGDVKSGMSGEEILKKYQAIAAARMTSLLLDGKAAFVAAKDILDRTGGKAIERKAIQHAFQDLSEKELDALIVTALKEDEE